MDWDLARFVLAIARHGTASAAAQALAVDQTTVSRRLAAAEAALGTTLFERIEKRFRPTPVGAVVIAQAEVMDRAAIAMAHAARDRDAALSGPVRDLDPAGFAGWSDPAHGRSGHRHPGCGPPWLSTDINADLERRDGRHRAAPARPGSIRTGPDSAASRSRAAWAMAIAARSITSAWAMTTAPTGVGRKRFSIRSNSVVPSAASAAARRRDTVVWSTASACAAAEAVPWRAIARTKRARSQSIPALLQVHSAEYRLSAAGGATRLRGDLPRRVA